MTIASSSFKIINPFLGLSPRMSAEDDLFAELLGDLSKPFELTSKRLYDYAVLQDGIENSTADFVKAVTESVEKFKGAIVQSEIDLTRLNRPVVVQVKAKNPGHPAIVSMLSELQKSLNLHGRSLVVYPAHEALSTLGGSLARDLRSALKLTGIVPPLGVDSEITETFCRATRELFEIQLKTPVRFVGASIRAPGTQHGKFCTGAIELEGASVSINALITLPENSLLTVMKRMSGLPEVPEEMVKNGPAEFANVVGGAARGFLNSGGYALRSPSLPKSYGPDTQHLLAAADSSTAVEVKLDTEFGEAFLEIRFYS